MKQVDDVQTLFSPNHASPPVWLGALGKHGDRPIRGVPIARHSRVRGGRRRPLTPRVPGVSLQLVPLEGTGSGRAHLDAAPRQSSRAPTPAPRRARGHPPRLSARSPGAPGRGSPALEPQQLRPSLRTLRTPAIGRGVRGPDSPLSARDPQVVAAALGPSCGGDRRGGDAGDTGDAADTAAGSAAPAAARSPQPQSASGPAAAATGLYRGSRGPRPFLPPAPARPAPPSRRLLCVCQRPPSPGARIRGAQPPPPGARPPAPGGPRRGAPTPRRTLGARQAGWVREGQGIPGLQVPPGVRPSG